MNTKSLPILLLVVLLFGAGTYTTELVYGEPGMGIVPIYADQFGSDGIGDGQFKFTTGLAMNDTHIFVGDLLNDRVQIFDLAGNFKDEFGSSGSDDGHFNHPYGIAINDTHIFVADDNNHRIQIFDLSGNFKQSIGSFGNENGNFSYPMAVAVSNTQIFVADTVNCRVQIFDMAGNFIDKFGVFGSEDGQFVNPSGIEVNSTHIFVADSDNHRIQIFDMAGNFKKMLGSIGDGSGGDAAGEFRSPMGITVDESNFFVADYGNYRIQVFHLNGTFVTKYGISGAGDGEFSSPHGIEVNGTHILVADRYNNRVQILKRVPDPSNLATESNEDVIWLSWVSPSVKPLHYRIYRGPTVSDMSMIAEKVDNVYFVDNDPVADQLNYYGVTAVYSSGESELSNIASAMLKNPTTITETTTETTTTNYTTTDAQTSTVTTTVDNYFTETISDCITTLANISDYTSHNTDGNFSTTFTIISLTVMILVIRKRKRK